MLRFINDDAIININSKNAVKTSKTELFQEIKKLGKLYDAYDELDEIDETIYEEEFFRTCLKNLFPEKELSNLKDMESIVYNSENIYFEKDNKSLIGFNTLKNGLSFLGITLSGDGGFALFLIIYKDKEGLKCYVPKKGNMVNLDFNTAIGLEEETLKNINFNKKLKEYTSLGIVEKNDIIKDRIYQYWDRIYFRKYEIDFNSIKDTNYFNWQAIEEDIIKTFNVL